VLPVGTINELNCGAELAKFLVLLIC